MADQELLTLSKLLAPYEPLTAESCWEISGGEKSVHNTQWPDYDPNLELEELVTIAIQVNGKLRGT